MKKCYICDRSTKVGNQISHSQRKTKRKFSPNLSKVKLDNSWAFICSKCKKKMQYLKTS